MITIIDERDRYIKNYQDALDKTGRQASGWPIITAEQISCDSSLVSLDQQPPDTDQAPDKNFPPEEEYGEDDCDRLDSGEIYFDADEKPFGYFEKEPIGLGPKKAGPKTGDGRQQGDPKDHQCEPGMTEIGGWIICKHCGADLKQIAP
ncbi:MAG: hypothetical protein IIC28_03835 [Chloroflexi bacterium]|nr:hypothetical protein [Chloroflexota bacterium]